MPSEAPECNISWEVDHDFTVKPPNSIETQTYDWFSVEVRSPAMWYGPGMLTQVRRVCETLTNTFRTNVNEICGLHLHVGQGNNGFSVATLQQLMGLLWAFDTQIYSIHPLRRRSQSVAAKWCLGLRADSMLAERSRPKRQDLTGIHGFERESASQGQDTPDNMQAICTILETKNLFDLVRLFLSSAGQREYYGVSAN